MFVAKILAETAGAKSDWVMTASSIWAPGGGIPGNPVPEIAKDGIKTGTAAATTMFHTGANDRYPWLQIDLRIVKLVKAVHLYR